MKELLNIIRGRIPLSNDAENYIISISQEKIFPKKSILLDQNEFVSKIFFVIDGCLRSFCVDSHGKEHTLHFATENNWISDYIAFRSDESATFTIESLTESKVIEFDANNIFGMLKLFPELETLQREILERLFLRLEKRILNQMQFSAAERYDLFLSENPRIEEYTRNYHIASYLGITQESLSRIRSERVKK